MGINQLVFLYLPNRRSMQSYIYFIFFIEYTRGTNSSFLSQQQTLCHHTEQVINEIRDFTFVFKSKEFSRLFEFQQ